MTHRFPKCKKCELTPFCIDRLFQIRCWPVDNLYRWKRRFSCKTPLTNQLIMANLVEWLRTVIRTLYQRLSDTFHIFRVRTVSIALVTLLFINLSFVEVHSINDESTFNQLILMNVKRASKLRKNGCDRLFIVMADMTDIVMAD